MSTTLTGNDATGTKIVINGPGIPSGCICSYTWDYAAPGRIVRNGAMSTCPADHEAAGS